MQGLDALGRVIEFKQPWKMQGDKKDIIHEMESFREKLPTTSQWHLFRQRILAAESLDEIIRFLAERREKASSRTKWTFRFRTKPFNEFLIDTFLKTLQDAEAFNKIKGIQYFGLKLGPLPDKILRDFPLVKLIVAKQALLRFIDQVILLKENISFSISYDGPNGKVKVCL